MKINLALDPKDERNSAADPHNIQISHYPRGVNVPHQHFSLQQQITNARMIEGTVTIYDQPNINNPIHNPQREGQSKSMATASKLRSELEDFIVRNNRKRSRVDPSSSSTTEALNQKDMQSQLPVASVRVKTENGSNPGFPLGQPRQPGNTRSPILGVIHTIPNNQIPQLDRSCVSDNFLLLQQTQPQTMGGDNRQHIRKNVNAQMNSSPHWIDPMQNQGVTTTTTILLNQIKMQFQSNGAFQAFINGAFIRSDTTSRPVQPMQNQGVTTTTTKPLNQMKMQFQSNGAFIRPYTSPRPVQPTTLHNLEA